VHGVDWENERMNEAAPLGDAVPVSMTLGVDAPIAVTLRLVQSQSPGLSHWYAMVEGLDAFYASPGEDEESPVVVTLSFPDASTTRAFITRPQAHLDGIRFVTGPGKAPRALGGPTAGVREPLRPRPSTGSTAAAEPPTDAS